MLQNIRLAMLDVDGTLRHGNDWLPGALDLLTTCHDFGWRIALCSGRPSPSLQRIAEQINTLLPDAVDWVASGNGTAVWERTGGTWVQRDAYPIPVAAVDELLAWARAAGVASWAMTAEHWLAETADEVTVRIGEFIDNPAVITPLAGRGDLTKLEFVRPGYGLTPEPERVIVPAELLEPHGLIALEVMPGASEIVLRAAADTKGGELLVADLNLAWRNVFAAGNGVNDLGMLSRAAVAAALPPLTPEEARTVGAQPWSGPDEVATWLRASADSGSAG